MDSSRTMYCSETRRPSLPGMRYMRTRKITWRMTRCYYPCRMHSHSILDHCTILEMLDVFSLCVIAPQSVLPTNSSPVGPPTMASSLPFTAPDMPSHGNGQFTDMERISARGDGGHFRICPSQAKVLREETCVKRKSTSLCLLSILAFERIAGLGQTLLLGDMLTLTV